MTNLRHLAYLSLVVLELTYQAMAGVWSPPAHTWGGSSTDSAYSVAVDSSGDVYVAGYTESFGAGGQDVLITKYGPSGKFLWAKTWGGSGDEYASSIKMGPDGLIYVAGYTSSFGAGWYDLFLLQLDTGGDLKWGTTWGGSSFDGGHDIAFDASGNIYVVGESYSTSPCCTVVLLKFSTGGSLLQETYYKSSATYDTGYSLAVDSNFNVIVAGISWDYSISPLHTSILLLKFDPAGSLIWQKNWSTPFPGQDESTASHSLATDSAGNIYIGGGHSANCQTTNFSLCDFDAQVLKLDANGNFQWAKTWGEAGAFDFASSVGLDPQGHLLASGVKDSLGTPLLFMLSFDAAGNLLSQTGWASQNTASTGAAVAMSIDSAGYAYLVSSASNNTGSWAATSATTGSLPNSLVTNTYSVGTASLPTSGLTNPTVPRTGTKDTGGGGADLFVAQYQPYMSGGTFLTNFPLPGQSPWTAQIISVFDHAMSNIAGEYHIYGFDGTVEAFTAEVGSCTPVPTCAGKQDGYFKADGSAFAVNGNYVGVSRENSNFRLQYEGHPGYDYVASCTPFPGKCTKGTPVYAAVSGTIHYPDTEAMVGVWPCNAGCSPPWQYHALELIPATPTYVAYYLHLATYGGVTNSTSPIPGADPTCTTPPQTTFPLLEGTYVTAGCVIAESGNTAPPPGVGPHLHFELQKVLDPHGLSSYLSCLLNGVSRACVPVDPYGWAPILDSTGGVTDPYIQAVNVYLWQ